MNKNDLIKSLDGDNFENFTIEKIFSYKHYEVLEKSHAQHRTKYFIHSNLNPDFKLKCKQTGAIFWIECKYLQSYVLEENREIPIKNDQLNRYKSIKENVFYLYGIGVYSQTISHVFLLPLKNMFENRIYESHLIKHKIPIKQIKNFNELLEITSKFPL